MRMMAVDYGDVRTGVAFCDVREMLATKVQAIVNNEKEGK